MKMQSYDRRQGDLASLAALPFDAVRGVLMGLPIQKKWAEIAHEQNKANYDNDIDAQRHADWHQKMAQTFGPRNAVRVGDLYEDVSRIGGPWVGKPYRPAADRMDRYNNRVGAHSVITGHQPTRDDLQVGLNQRATNYDFGLGSYDPNRPRRSGR